MQKILSSPPDLSWEVSRRQPESDYWHFPGGDHGPGFFLGRNGFHYSEHDNFALSYERTADGFTLVEVKKRSVKQRLAQCPVFFPIENCVERHALMIATLLSCGSSCTYHLIVFDSYSPFQILGQDPSISSLMKRLVDAWLPPPDIDIKFEQRGVVFDSDSAWGDYIADRFAFIAAEIRNAPKTGGFRLRNPLPW